MFINIEKLKSLDTIDDINEADLEDVDKENIIIIKCKKDQGNDETDNSRATVTIEENLGEIDDKENSISDEASMSMIESSDDNNNDNNDDNDTNDNDETTDTK